MTATAPQNLRPSQRPPHRPRHRILTLIIVVLLIAVPAGYVVKSAFESRDSGEDKERNAAATNLTYGWPSKVQRNVYDVPLPSKSSHYAFYEANSWQTSTLYVQFRLPEKQLGDFLDDVGTSSSALRPGQVTISGKEAETVGWDLDKDGHDYEGTTYRQGESRPDVAITVDRTYKNMPRVYVVSTVKF
ncbi:hypothetical protein DB35_09035 [Streptomyces abyssalis]|uniref:Sugar kinase n=1 Tax=Streptomyces abyssalis TaxID=933944 RepID=A0A1E7JS33_9ACTN|nr:hypothetical protein [Streptomyces abyssalis]OEU91656.1 hypothetical protein AN215_03780 [Streptomyces abyssalis]OEU94207.1 hypothetical protein DB35_09035 [Streptomyces abyssalis]OEV05990.1 hypothetical protein AN219_35740 [Streptomyces nanshensis]